MLKIDYKFRGNIYSRYFKNKEEVEQFFSQYGCCEKISEIDIKLWKITANTKFNLDDLFIEADSFDEALKKARNIDTRYNTGQPE